MWRRLGSSMRYVESTRGKVTIRTLLPGEESQVGEVIGDSHSTYPSFTHLFPDPDRRTRVLRALMRGVARDARPFGAVSVAMAGDRMVGAAVWLPPGQFPWSPWRKLRAGGTFLPVLWAGRGSLRRFFALGKNAELASPHESHWYLQVLGIRKEAQGRGLGTRLLQPVLSRADQEGTLCYLETADPANLAFYERLGFHFDRRLQLIPGGPPHYAMRRPPEGRP